MRKIIFLGIAFVCLALMGVGCIKFTSGPTGETGGVWKTADQGETWEQKVKFPTAQGVGEIGQVNIKTIAVDPSDHLAIYAGTTADGLIYSYDGAETWNSAKQLDTGPVAAIAVDPGDKCTLYAATRNKIYKSEDCSRTFEQVYYETRTDVDITAIEVDWYNHSVVYAGTSDGDLLKSTDAGASWSAVHRFDGDVNDFLVDPFDSRVLYVATENKGLWKSADSGESWNDFDAELRDFKNSRDIYFIVADKTSQNTIIIATKYGLIRSYDGGDNWSEIELVTPPGTATITALAINPREGKEIFYTTKGAFYKSLDSGTSWVTKKIPAVERSASALAIDTENAKVIYLGVAEGKDEQF